MATRIITESGFLFDPPEGCFRWQDGPYFALRFKGVGLCEMDFAWHDPTEDVLHLLELPMATCADVRAQVVYALRDDLIGPDRAGARPRDLRHPRGPRRALGAGVPRP